MVRSPRRRGFASTAHDREPAPHARRCGLLSTHRRQAARPLEDAASATPGSRLRAPGWRAPIVRERVGEASTSATTIAKKQQYANLTGRDTGSGDLALGGAPMTGERPPIGGGLDRPLRFRNRPFQFLEHARHLAG